MTPIRALYACIAAIVLIVGGVWIYKHHAQAVADAAIVQANIHHEQAITQAAHGAVTDQAIHDLQPELDKAKSEVERLKAKLASIKPLVPALTPPISAGTVAQDPVSSVKDEIIAAQDTQINGLETQVINLALSRDSWKGAYEASTKEVASMRLAHQAQVAAIKGSRWMGRFEGFAVGVAAGYLAGKR